MFCLRDVVGSGKTVPDAREMWVGIVGSSAVLIWPDPSGSPRALPATDGNREK